MPYYDDGSGRAPRYYQANAINNTVEAVAKGQQRILLVMATGTGKTYTAFQIIWRLWKSGTKKRILFLADRNILVDQTKNNDFKPFGAAMTKISKRQIDKATKSTCPCIKPSLAARKSKTSTSSSRRIFRSDRDRRVPSWQRLRRTRLGVKFWHIFPRPHMSA
jgi:type I site-specific restriction endonuclease